MKTLNRYIYLLLFCIFLQNNNSGFVDFLRSLIDSNDHLSLFLENSDNSAPEEEKEENEKESKENENKEKEKELKNIKYLHSFVFLSVIENANSFRKVEDSVLFSLHADIETPPPKYILVV